MIDIDFNNMAIEWDNWRDMPKIDALLNEMKRLLWNTIHLSEYLCIYHSFVIHVRYHHYYGSSVLRFDNKSEMDLFILHFL